LATSVGLSSSKKKGMGGDDVQVEYLNVSGWIPLVVDMPTSCCTLV
jgi:hypothetical protein